MGRQGRGRGDPGPARKDVKPPPHWRLEAVARDGAAALARARRRPPPRRLHPGPRHVRRLAARPRAIRARERLTTGRDPMPYWEDTEPRLSPDGDAGRLRRGGPRLRRPRRRRPAARLLGEAGSPVWVDDAHAASSRSSATDESRLAVVDVADPWPRRLATDHGELEEHGDEWGAAVSPDRTEVAYVFTPRADLNRSEIRVADLATRRRARAHRHAAACRTARPPGRPTARRSPTSPSARAAGRCTSSARRRRRAAAHDATTADYGEPAGTRTATGSRRRAACATASGSSPSTRPPARSPSSPPAASGARRSGPRRAPCIGTYEDHATPPELRSSRPGARAQPLLAPAPLAVRSAPHVAPEDVTFRSRDGLVIPAFLFRPRDASRRHARAGGRLPARRPDRRATSTSGTATPQYFVDKGYAWLAINFRGSTGYGRDFERRNHDVWGVEDTWDCLAARRPPAHARLGRRRPARDLRRQLRLLHGAPVGHRRPGAPLPLRGRQVRRLRHRHVVGAGRPRGRPGPRADDGPAGARRARRTAPARRSTGSTRSRRRC